MTALSEDEYIEYMHELRELERGGDRQEVAFGPYTALVVIGALQLATRHPAMNDYLRAELAAVIDQFRPWFAGTSGEQIIDMGNNPEQDR